MIKPLTETLYLISNALLPPVLIILLLMLGWTVCLFGGFLRELWERKKVRTTLIASLAAATRGDRVEDVWRELTLARAGLPLRLSRMTQPSAINERSLTRALSELEHDIAESLAKHSLITRVAPMLGLMGTLIPLGPALNGLATGNIQTLASNLVIAFTATVIGLFISGIAFSMALARRTWYSRDFSDLELLCEKMTAKGQ